jgi:carboxypeptidase
MLSIRTIASLTLGAAMMFESWGYMMPHQDPTDTLILVNKNNKAPAVPVTLVKPDVQPTRETVSENIYMRPEAAAALEDLFEAAAQDGITLYATSGYRSYSTQKAIFERKLERMDEKQANASVAKPGYSEHQTGLAMDIEGETTKGTGLTEAFGESPEGIWTAEHCAEYGFIIRYPKGKTNITGYIYEPWHLRYVGKDAAAEITELGVTFEEYILAVRSERIETMQEETRYEQVNP